MSGDAFDTAASEAKVACARCGTTVAGVPLTWSTSTERGRLSYYCDRCSREHLRAMEGKLDADFW
ncbi:MAG TPA: hypothetical protein VEV13_03880 [Candidatus Limnocylindria bacterium]|nr:hypothetical protein [Candidatus Limnocylindria bacterium]